MKKRLIACLCIISLCVLNACGLVNNNLVSDTNNESYIDNQGDNADDEAYKDDMNNNADKPDYTTGSPWIDSSLYGNLSEDSEYSLKDDYAAAVNKDYNISTPFPKGHSNNMFLTSNEIKLNDIIVKIMEDDSLSSHEAVNTQLLYNSFMNFDNRDELGVEPIMKYVNRLKNITKLDELSDYLATEKTEGMSIFLQIGMAENYDNSSEYMTIIDEAVLSLDDSDDYTNPDAASKGKEQLIREFYMSILDRIGYSKSEAMKAVDDYFDYQYLIAPTIYTNLEYNAPNIYEKIMNYTTLDELIEMEGDVPFDRALVTYGYDKAPSIVVTNPEYIKKLSEIYTQDNLEMIKNALIIQTVARSSQYLDSECFKLYTDFVNTLYGIAESEELNYTAAHAVSNEYPFDLGRLYCEYYYTDEDKERITDVIQQFVDEYKLMLADEDFLSEETRKVAIDKLDNMELRVLYPDDWKQCNTDFDYSDENKGNLIEMFLEHNKYLIDKDAQKIDKPVDGSEWYSGPLLVNAEYYPTQNNVYLYAGIVGDVLYNSEMSNEEVFAYLGSIIGHEITHGFDSNGAQFDEEGNRKTWWSDEDYSAFMSKVEKMDKYYDSISLWEGANCSGQMLDTEATADMGAMACALRLAAKQGNFDYDKYFRSFAHVWAGVNYPEVEEYNHKADVHPSSYLRINVTLAQFDEFYETYDIQPHDGMYIAPEDRIKIW